LQHNDMLAEVSLDYLARKPSSVVIPPLHVSTSRLEHRGGIREANSETLYGLEGGNP
jgi:hypothetical protein